MNESPLPFRPSAGGGGDRMSYIYGASSCSLGDGGGNGGSPCGSPTTPGICLYGQMSNLPTPGPVVAYCLGSGNIGTTPCPVPPTCGPL